VRTDASGGGTAVVLERVSRVYGSFVALREVSLRIEAGASVVLLGENGAGKSTLLKLLAGLAAPSRGRVEVLGGTPREQRSRIAYMSHQTMLYDELTGLENLTYFAALGHRAPQARALAERWLGRVGLDAMTRDAEARRRVGEYSQGMRQRTSLARVLADKPDLLLLDEPFANLDAASAQAMVAQLQRYLDEGAGGRTLLLTTHQPELARPLARTTITLRSGRVESLESLEPKRLEPAVQEHAVVHESDISDAELGVGTRGPGELGYAATVLLHLRKDLRLEWRSKDSLNGTLFFALLVVVVFAMAFDPTAFPAIARQTSGGLLCVSVLFASLTALNQSWARETLQGALDAQRMARAPLSALLVGKALANFLFVTAVEALLTPVFAVFYNLHPLGEAWKLLLILPLGTWALVVNGTFFAALSLRTRNRETMLPLVLLPVSIPALLAMIQATTAVLTGEFEPTLWLKVLLAYAVVFTTACVLLFETVLLAE